MAAYRGRSTWSVGFANLPFVAALLAALVCVLVNARATVALVRSDAYSTFQKTAQVILVWLVPILGVLLVLYLLREVQPPRPAGSSADAQRGHGGLGYDTTDLVTHSHSETSAHDDP